MRRRLHRTDDRGAAAIEFALLFPIFVVLTFGMISAAIAFSRQINMVNAAREGSRYASTLSVTSAGGSTQAWLQKVDSATTAAIGGATNPFGGYTSRCVLLFTAGSGGAYSVNGGTAVTGASVTHCPGASKPVGLTNYVQVYVTRSTSFNYIIADPTFTLKTSSTTPYEAQ